MGNAAKAANVWSEWGGRNSMAQHLSDEQQLLQYKTLLNRQNWLLFTSPQQAYAWRQQELQQVRQLNYARWSDYTSPDQYLAFVQREISVTKLMNDQIFSQADSYRADADAAGRYAAALSAIHGPEGGLEGLQALQSALAGVPAELTTVMNVDDAAALAALSAYQASLANIPSIVTTTLVSARAGPGEAPAPGSGVTGTPEVIPVSYGGPYQEQFAAIMAELAELSRLRVEIPVHFELPPAAEVAAFVSQIPTAGITEPVHLAPEGGSVGVGPGPPPETIAAWKALAAAERDAAAAGAEAGAAPPPEDEAAWQALVGRVGAYYDALEKADAEALRAAKDFAPAPAAVHAWEQLTLGVDGFGEAVDAAATASGWRQLALDTEYISKDAAAWTVLSAAEDKATASAARLITGLSELHGLEVPAATVPYAAGGAGGAGKPPTTPVTPAAAEPPEDAAAKWAALSDAEKAAGMSAAEAAVRLQALAAAADNAGDQAKYMYAAGIAASIADSALGDAALGAATKIIAQAAAASSAADASKGAFAANMALAAAEKAVGDSALVAAAEVKAAGDAAAGAGATFGKGLIAFNGWRTAIAVFGGLAGSVGVIHLLVDGIIELIAITFLAAVGIAAISAAVGIFIGVANEAQDTLGRISDRLKAVYTASSATGQAIYPLTQNFDALAKVIRPEVWELYGDALNLVTGRMGLIGSIAEKTGAYLDQLAAKIVVFIDNPGFQHGLSDLVKAGIAVLGQLLQIGKNLGDALVNFAKVMETTHIAEDLLAIINAGAKLLDLISKLPTPILALAVGLHGLYLWGGLLATGLLSLLDPLRSVALGIGGVDAASTELAATASDASGWDKLKATLSDIGAGFGNLPSRIAGTTLSLKDISAQVAGSTVPDLAALKAYSLQTGTAMEDMVPAAKAAQVESLILGTTMSDTGKEALYLAAAAGATDAELADMAGSEAVAAAGTVGLRAAVIGLRDAMLSLLANPLTWLVLLAAGIAYATDKIITANDATQKWITSMDAALSKTSTYKVIGQTVQDLAAATTALAAAQKTGVGNASELAAAQQDLSAKLGNELVNTAQVSKAYGVDMPGALDLLQVAQVKTSALMSGPMSAAWKAAMVQVAGLVQGYKAMGQGLTQLQGDVSVQLVMNADQLASMAKLNTAWDSWLTLVTGGQTALNGFQTQLATVVTNTKATGAAMDGLNANSLTLTGSFQTLVTNGGTLLDSIRSQSAVLENGAEGTKLLNQATKDLAAQMIPLAGNSKEAQAGILALVQEANPSITTWQELTKWVGPLGAAGAAQSLTGIMTKLEVPVSNLSADAAKLTTALQADLNPAMATAEFNAEGGQSAFNKFADALKSLGPSAQPTITAGTQVAKILESVDGSAAKAKPQFVAWAESMGLSAAAANKLWVQVSAGVTPSSALAAGLGKSAKSANDLASSGLWAQMKDLTTQGFGQIAHFFDSQLPGFFLAIPKYSAEAWGSIWDGPKGFDQDVARPIASFFTTGLPGDFKTASSALSGTWGTSYNGFQRDFAGPLTAWWTQSFPHALGNISTAFATAWGTSYNGFQRDLAGPLTAWWTQSFPHALNIIGGAFSTAWGTAYNGFQRDLAGPVTYWATQLLPKSMAGIAVSAAWSTTYENFQRDLAGPLTSFFTKTAPQDLNVVGTAFSSTWSQAWTAFSRDIVSPIEGVFTKTIPGLFSGTGKSWNGTSSGMWSDFVRDVVTPLNTLFTKTIQNWLDGDGRYWNSTWSSAWAHFASAIVAPLNTLFTKTIPGWFGGTGTSWEDLWNKAWAHFYSAIIAPLNTLFTKTMQNWLDGDGRYWNSTWSKAWADFVRDIIDPLNTLFTRTLPDWLDSDGRAWNSTWSKGWDDFVRDIINPMSHFFTSTLPNLISGAVRNGVNEAIHYLNDAIDIINAVTNVVGIPKIGHIGSVAAAGGVMPSRMASGSIAGTGDEDGTHIIAMGGEYMLRKPARMALEATYGRGFMNHLNQADTWLGSGSRGNTASQQTPHGMASGGRPGPVFLTKEEEGPATGFSAPRAFPFPAKEYASGGQVVSEAERFIGAPYVYGGTSPSGWDCSGFVQYVLEALGWHNVPRTSESQYAWTSHESEPSVGGLVFAQFPGDNAAPGHVGFYVGNGQVLSARDPSSGTGIDSLSSWRGYVYGYGNEPNATGLIGQAVGGIGGLIAESWQSVEGLLNAAGDALSGDMAPLAGYVTGGAKELLTLAQQGGEAVFNAIWSDAVTPLLNKALPGGGETVPDAFLKYVAADVKAGVDSAMGAKDAAAQASSAATGVGPPGGSSTPGLETVARYIIAHGGTKNSGAGVAGVVAGESGGNPEALEAGGGGGAGLIQWTPESSAKPYQPIITGNASKDMATQLDDMLYYINGRGGIGAINAPGTALGAAQVFSRMEAPAVAGSDIMPSVISQILAEGLAAGGPVGYASGGAALETTMSHAGESYPGIEVPDITGHQAGPAHNILVAAGLEPTAAAGQQPTWYVTGSNPATDVSIARGAPVTILADPGAAATPINVPDLTDYAAGTAHNILVAAGFVPVAVSTQKPWWRVTGSSPAAGTAAKAGTRVTIIATANVVQVPILAGYTAGSAHDALVTAGLYPVAAAGQQPYWYVTGTSPAAGVWVQPGAAVAILASAAAPSPAEGAGGIGAAANWPNASALMAHAEGAQDAAFWALNAAPVTGATRDQWGQWYADLGILQTNQKLISSQWGAMQPLVDSSPEGLTTTDWMNFQASTTNQAAWLQDKPTPPSGLWGQEKNVPWPAGFKTSAGKAPGSIPPSAWAPWKYAHTPWQTAVTDAANLKNDERAAYGAWAALWGPAGAISTSPPTPGLQVLPGSGGPITVNLEPLIPGGPAFPVMALTPGSLSATGSGFAAGGGLGDVAGMFAPGGIMPQFAPAGLPSMASPASGASDNPRTMTSAASSASGDRVGVKVGNLTINNPVPERPSDSITRSTNRLAFLAGRGMS